LDFCANEIQGNGVTYLLKSINSSITDLNLGECTSLGDASLEMFCPLLENNTNIKSLNLQMALFGPEGCLYLAEVLKKNQTLEFLGIGGNHFGEKGWDNL
jgi:hypothetical protein